MEEKSGEGVFQNGSIGGADNAFGDDARSGNPAHDCPGDESIRYDNED